MQKMQMFFMSVNCYFVKAAQAAAKLLPACTKFVAVVCAGKGAEPLQLRLPWFFWGACLKKDDVLLILPHISFYTLVRKSDATFLA